MFLFQKIEEMMMTHKDARHAVGKFVLEQKDNLYKYTVNDIAEQTYTSKATVVRFAKALGFDGWKDFIKAFISEIKYQEAHQTDIDANYPFYETSSTQEIIDGLKKVQIESIQDTADLLDVPQVKRAVDYLEESHRVIIFGLSPNNYLGELFRRKMMGIDKIVEIARLGEMGLISRTMTENDCAIMISYSGNSVNESPVLHLQTLLDNKVPVIAITSDGDNYLRRNVSCILTMSSKERLYTKISNFATEESIQYILNILFSCFYARNYRKNNSFKLRTSHILENQRKTSLNRVKEE